MDTKACVDVLYALQCHMMIPETQIVNEFDIL